MSNVAKPPPSSGQLPLLQSEYKAPVIRKALESISEMQTAFIELSPTFFAALQSIAPKKRRGQVRYVIAAALLAFVGAILLDGATRTFLVERGHALMGRPEVAAPATNEATPTSAVLPVAPTTPPVVAAPPAPVAAPAPADAPVVPAAVTANASVAKPAVKSGKDGRTPAAAPVKRNSRKSTRAPRPAAQPQTPGAPVALASRDSDGF